MSILKRLIVAALVGIIWAAAFFVVRRLLNPSHALDTDEVRQGALTDAIFGGLAASVIYLMTNFIQ